MSCLVWRQRAARRLHLRPCAKGECDLRRVALELIEAQIDRRLLVNMKRTIKLLALAAVVAVFAVPALAQSKECNDENKGAWYKTFYDNFKGDAAAQKVAYDAAKKYIDTCPDDANDAQRKYMKKFMDLVD